jgi:hypothetical protein
LTYVRRRTQPLRTAQSGVRDGSSLSQKQINNILDMGRSTDTTGIGLLNFANKSFAGNQSPSEMLGATSSDNRSVVFVGNVAQGLKSDDASTLTFRPGKVASRELGHGQGFESDRSFTGLSIEHNAHTCHALSLIKTGCMCGRVGR